MAEVDYTNIRQSPLIDQAEQVADRMLRPAFAPYVPLFADHFDAIAMATRLRDVSNAARETRGAADAADAAYLTESDEARQAVADFKDWLDDLDLGLRYARAAGNPIHPRLARIFEAAPDVESYSRGAELYAALHAHGLDISGRPYGLPEDWFRTARTLGDTMKKEQLDSNASYLSRRTLTARLHAQLAELSQKLELIDLARIMIERRTGTKIPGLEMALARSAAAGSGTAPSPAVDPAPAPKDPNDPPSGL